MRKGLAARSGGLGGGIVPVEGAGNLGRGGSYSGSAAVRLSRAWGKDLWRVRGGVLAEVLFPARVRETWVEWE